MYRSVLALFFAAVLLLSGCAAGRQTVPKEKSGQEANMDGPAFDRSDEEITYMDTTENVIYLAGGCFWGMEQLMQSIPGVIDAESGYANGTCEADADYMNGLCDAGALGAREQHAVDPERRIGVFLHRLVSIIQLGDAGRRKGLRHGRDEQIVGSGQGVHGQQTKRRRTVDEDIIVRFLHRSARRAARGASSLADVVQLLLNARKDGIGRNDIAARRVLASRAETVPFMTSYMVALS